MDRNNLPGLTPVAIIALMTILFAFATIAVPYVFSHDEVKASDWFGFAGNIITAGVALIAIRYAWLSIKMQTEIDIISREEERMEALLPGLDAALVFLIDLDHALVIQGDVFAYRIAFESFNLWLLDMNEMQVQINKRLPTTDASTRLQIARRLPALASGVSEYQAAQQYMLDPGLIDRTPQETAAGQFQFKTAKQYRAVG